MKAIILAAGMGTRLGKYTENMPKGMLNFNGKPLIEWQILQLRKAGIDQIIIVTGYKKEKINFSNIHYYHNPNYATTNMVESLLCARDELNSDILITYSDIIFTDKLAKLITESKADIGVAVDKSWRDYWQMRYGTTENDLESLTVKDNKIVELGKSVNNSLGIDFRYIGMIKFSVNGIQRALDIYDNKKMKNEYWIQSGKEFKQGYMTDMLNELILMGNIVTPIVSDGGWLEFDTFEDYEIVLKKIKGGIITYP
ncbi:MAG: phosphocholine cytidylyltransferase family protein [Bacteroidetes bacterium]|nr:phosphocholine cytidylyltransferase family protein [Bacteroidota bacterium]